MIPVSRPTIGQKEIENVTKATLSGWVSSLGPYVDEFECKFAAYCGTRFAVAVSNGTVGLHLALVASGVTLGDEVIVPDLTFVATPNSVCMANASPIIVDIRRDTYCIDPEQIERAITKKTKAIIPVHLYGHPAAMSSIQEIAEKYSLKVIEDAAEAHGAEISGKRVGSFGDCAVFSFYGNKIITTGEGGMITTDDEQLNNKLRFLRDHAMSKTTRYWHTEVGFNYRMTNLQAAIGVAQLERIDEFINERKKQLDLYRKLLEPHGIECNPSNGVNSVNWLTCAVITGIGRTKRDKIIEIMRERGIDTRPFFYPVSMFPMYKMSKFNPISSELSANGINLPTYIELKKEEIEMICEALIETIEKIY